LNYITGAAETYGVGAGTGSTQYIVCGRLHTGTNYFLMCSFIGQSFNRHM